MLSGLSFGSTFVLSINSLTSGFPLTVILASHWRSLTVILASHRPQSYFKKLKTSFSPSSSSKKMCWGQGWAEASLSVFCGSIFLYVPLSKNITKWFLFIITHNFSIHFAINLFICTSWKHKQTMEQHPHCACEKTK